MHRQFFCILLLFCSCCAIAESVRVLRAPVWIYTERMPGIAADEAPVQKTSAALQLDQTARFIMGGMLYGWKFTYTPSDTLRNVTEYFSLQPIKEIPPSDPRFLLTDIQVDYPRLSCWAEFTLDESLSYWTSYWASVLFKNAGGRGRGERKDEANGIKTAYTQAVLFSVREYARKLEKNKPKEIIGEVLLRNNARLFADEGYFVADIRVLINIQDMVPYRTF